MSATQDESQDLDAGWDDTEVGAAESSAEPEPSAEEVDGGWDDAESEVGPGPHRPTGSSIEPSAGVGRRRPHRKRRAKSQAALLSTNPVLLPRPAEPTKKQQREHARQQRAYEAVVKQQRKAERKAERAEQAKQEATERVRRAEAEEQARKMREEARERARSEKPAPSPAVAKAKRAKPRAAELDHESSKPVSQVPKRGPRYGVIVTLLALAAIAALLLLRK